MTPEQLAEIEALGAAAAKDAPPPTPAQLDLVRRAFTSATPAEPRSA